MGIIYLVQPDLVKNTQIYKIGLSKNVNLTRIQSYGLNTKIINVFVCSKHKQVERRIKDVFKTKFKLASGTEYFEGNIDEIIVEFNKIKDDYTNGYFDDKYDIAKDIIGNIIDNAFRNVKMISIKKKNEEFELREKELKKIIEIKEKNKDDEIKKRIDMIQEIKNDIHEKQDLIKYIQKEVKYLQEKKNTNNVCSFCKKDFYYNSHLKKHLNTQKPCFIPKRIKNIEDFLEEDKYDLKTRKKGYIKGDNDLFYCLFCNNENEKLDNAINHVKKNCPVLREKFKEKFRKDNDIFLYSET